jgi:uncharacterized membrane protein YfcA
VLTWILLVAAALAAGVVNAIAGGGSLISFPALLATGMGSVRANATNTLGMWPGSVSSVWAYRGHIAGERHRAAVLAVPSLLGGLGGSVLLLNTPESAFRAFVPWLILFACGLLALQARVARWVAGISSGEAPRVPVSLWVAQLLISVYGGYFGAGIGILMLSAMAILIPSGLQAANGLKVLFATLINGISAIYFLVVGAVGLPEAGVMALAAITGGWLGAHLAQRLPARAMRALVVAYGVVVALRLLAR